MSAEHLTCEASFVSHRLGPAPIAFLFAMGTASCEEGPRVDAGVRDAAHAEADAAAAAPETGARDAGALDGSPDAGAPDATAPDASPPDSGFPDATAAGRCPGFSVETIFPPSTTDAGVTSAGSASSLVFDPSGAAHVSFAAGDRLHYGSNRSGAWRFESIDSLQPVTTTQLVLDGAGKAHVVFHDGSGFDLQYATNASGAWVRTPVDQAGYVGEDLSFALDAQGNLHIAYLDASNEDLKYATGRPGAWTFEVADANIVGRVFPSLLLAGGEVLVAYSTYSSGLFLGTRTAQGVWSRQLIDPGSDVGGWNAMAIDQQGKLHISYRKHRVGNGELRYSTNASGSWATSIVDTLTNPFSSSIAVGGGGFVHIAYLGGGATEIFYATHDGTSWVPTVIDRSYSIVDGTSLAFDPSGRLNVTYRGGQNALDLATCR